MKRLFLPCSLLVIAGLSVAGCTSRIPHLIWPQKDLAPAEFYDPSSSRRILVAARESDFKAEVVRQVVEQLRNDGVYIRVIGINQLQHAAANQYRAILVVSTTMARSMDPGVTRFVDKVRDKSRVVLLTTSSDGEWAPAAGAYDALSSASRAEDARSLATRATESLRRRLAGK